MNSFERRLEQLHQDNAPTTEIDAAVQVYERLKTAIAICNAEAETRDKKLLETIFQALQEDSRKQAGTDSLA